MFQNESLRKIRIFESNFISLSFSLSLCSPSPPLFLPGRPEAVGLTPRAARPARPPPRHLVRPNRPPQPARPRHAAPSRARTPRTAVEAPRRRRIAPADRARPLSRPGPPRPFHELPDVLILLSSLLRAPDRAPHGVQSCRRPPLAPPPPRPPRSSLLRSPCARTGQPTSFPSLHRSSPARPRSPSPTGAPSRRSRPSPPTASTWSSLLRPSFLKTNPLASFLDLHWFSPIPPPPPQVAGTPPPRCSAAAGRRRLWSRCLGPPPREPRTPRGATQSPLPFPQLFPHRRSLSSPKTRPKFLLCSPMSARDLGLEFEEAQGAVCKAQDSVE